MSKKDDREFGKDYDELCRDAREGIEESGKTFQKGMQELENED